MSMISELVKELRSAAEVHKNNNRYMINLLNSAADTIETLSAKLSAANEELKLWHTNHINEKITNPFANPYNGDPIPEGLIKNMVAWQPLPQLCYEPSQADPPQGTPWKEHFAQWFGRVE